MKTSEIKNNPNNPRLIKDEKFKKLVQSIKDFPEMLEAREVVVNKDHIILGGNMRFKAAKEAGLKEIPVKIVDWDEDKQRQFIIKDNVSGGDWDWDIIANEWDAEELESWGLDLPEHTTLDKEVEEDEAPEVTEDPVSELGKVYQLGRHRVMCGDSTNFGEVSELMDGELGDLVFTDPPYNIDYEGKTKKRLKIKNDKFEGNEFYEFLLSVFTNYHTATNKGTAIYIAHADMERVNFQNALSDSGYVQKQNIIWVKDSIVLGRQDYHWRHEPILYGWKDDNGKHKWESDRKQDTVWEIKRPTRSEEHPTMKPIELCAKGIQNSSKKDEIVLDFFLGSGSTLIACEQLDRICYGMELDPRYVDVIRKRYAKHTTGGDLPDNWQELTPEV